MHQIVSRVFQPILAGATLRGRLIGCLGALFAIGLTGFFSHLVVGSASFVPLIVAPIGASAVLLFALPASPLAQPWPVIGGNVIATVVGVAVSKIIPDPVVASGVAVSLAILAMSLTRSLHPPGGAAALTAVIGGQAVTSAGFMFALTPVALNSAIIVLVAIIFHRLARTNYPHRPAAVVASKHGTTDPPGYARVGFSPVDVDMALASLGETFDIDRNDLALLLRQIELQALSRRLGSPTCGDIMSRDVVTIGLDASSEQALEVLLAHDIRTLPVVNGTGHLQGTIGLTDVLGKPPSTLRDRLSPAITVSATQSAVELLPMLSDGRHHAVIVVAPGREILGIVSQSDLLAALCRSWAG